MRTINAMFPGVLLAFFLVSGGCSSNNRPGYARPLKSIPAVEARPEFWYAKPSPQVARGLDFDLLWNACERTARDYQFVIDRQDYRQGVLSTRPMVSKQIFEPWRRDAGSVYDTLQSTLQTVRRTIRIEIVRTPEGAFEAQPKVLVEALSQIVPRVTSPSQYREVFILPPATAAYRTDEGLTIPVRYWYAIGRDETMERHIAGEVSEMIYQASAELSAARQ